MGFKVLVSPILRQYIVIIAVNLTILSTGLGLAWPSPMVVKLQDSSETILDEPITDDQAAWIVSTGFLVGALLNFAAPLLLDKLGFKHSIFIAMLPKVVGAFLMLFATEVWMLILARSLNGFSDTLVFTMVPTYAADIASKEVRGALSTILQIMCSLGILIMLSVGPFVSYFTGNILHVAVILVAMVPIPFLPESPYFLYVTEHTNDAIKVLTLLRGSETTAHEVLKEYAANTVDTVNKTELFRNKIFLKSLSLVLLIAVGSQLVGFHAVQYYLQTILESTQTSMRPEIASVIIGLIQLIASFFTAAVTDRLGRKPILCTSLIGMMVGMICLGVFFYVTEGADEIMGFLNYLPLIALILVVFCFSAGSGSLTWAVSAELFDNTGRSVGLTISMVLSGIGTFFMTRYFPTLVSSVGPAATYWVFSVNCLLLSVCILILVPETKGKSYIEIQRLLGANIVIDEEKDEK